MRRLKTGQLQFYSDMKRCVLFLLILICMTSFFCREKKNFLCNERVVEYRQFVLNAKDVSHVLPVSELNNMIWFKDSTVIYEIKAIFTDEYNGKSTRTVYQTYKYTFLDLRNMLCQDYYSLNDTAMPFSNYKLKQNEAVAWQFYSSKKERDLSKTINKLADSVIDGHNYKRVRTEHIFGDDHFEYEYFIDCDFPKSIFHINNTLEEKYPNCSVVRADLVDLNSNERKIFEFKINQQYLDTPMSKIFTKWEKNAKELKMPISSFNDVQTKIGIFENPSALRH